MKVMIQLQEVVDDLGAQAQVPDLERGFLELALLALRADEDQADGAERRFDCLHPEFAAAARALGSVREDDLVPHHAVSPWPGLPARLEDLPALDRGELEDDLMASRLAQQEALQRRHVNRQPEVAHAA